MWESVLAYHGRVQRRHSVRRLTEVGRFGDVYTLRVATLVHALLDEILGYGLERYAGLEASYVPNIGLYHAGEDRVDDLQGRKSGEAG